MLMVRNSLSGKKEEFKPKRPPKVSLYACGVTTYDDCHIGHGMQAFAFEMIRRYLIHQGYDVTYVRNFTDIDDKIIARAKKKNRDPGEFSDEMVDQARVDFHDLGVPPADYEPKVSEKMDVIIKMIERLLDRDYAYLTKKGHVYFRVRMSKGYGRLSHRDIEDQRNKTRDVVSDGKEDPLDFALWKAEDRDEYGFSSPFSWGRPGWHIECSAMSKDLLGHPLDIHGGGRDLIFPHHENELAQSGACFHKSCESVRYWLHSGLLTIDNTKMSKSLGNHITIRDFLDNFTPEVLRLCCWEHHYRQDINFSRQIFLQCERKLISYYEVLQQWQQHSVVKPYLDKKKELTIKYIRETGSDYGYRRSKKPHGEGEARLEEKEAELVLAFKEAMDDDFNTPRVLALWHGYIKQLRKLLALPADKLSGEDRGFLTAFSWFLDDVREVLGVFTGSPEAALQRIRDTFMHRAGLSHDDIASRIDQRREARVAGNYEKADKIRDELSDLGITLKDSSAGTTWTVTGEDL